MRISAQIFPLVLVCSTLGCGPSARQTGNLPSHHPEDVITSQAPEQEGVRNVGTSDSDWLRNIGTSSDSDWLASEGESCRQPTHDFDCDGVQSYLDQHPGGEHAGEAKALLHAGATRIEELYNAHAKRVVANSPKNADVVSKPTKAEVTRLTGECTHNKAASCLVLARMFSVGNGVTRDQARATELFKKACFEGSTTKGCHTVVGNMLADGEGVPKDLQKALSSFEAGCAEGDAASCHDAGTMFQNGDGTTPDLITAFRRYWTACDAGFPTGCLRLGILYRKGVSPMPKSPTRARDAFSWACDAGQAESCGKLGVLYTLGEGIPEDQAKALTAFRKCLHRRLRGGLSECGTSCR